MRYFNKLADGLPLDALREAILAQPELWNSNTTRTDFDGSAMVEVDDILIHFGETREDMTCKWHPAAFKLPVFPLLSGLMFQARGFEMKRVLISKLVPGARVLPHTDNEGYAASMPGLARYHMDVQGSTGNLYRCGDETVAMMTGELWAFDHTALHACLNVGHEDRIHLMIDIRSFPSADSPG